jgi:hypothetical protein
MKRLGVKIAIGIVVLLVLVLVVVFFSLNSIVKAGVEKVGPMVTKTEVHLDNAKISPFSGSGQLHGFVIGNPEGYKTPSAISVGDVKVSVQAGSVLKSTVVVDEISVEAPIVTFEGGLTGNNLSKLLANVESANTTEEPTNKDGKPKGEEKKFCVKNLLVRGGKINLNITGVTPKELTVPLPEIHLTNIGSPENGVTSAELTKQILQTVLVDAVKAAVKAAGQSALKLGGDTKDIGKGTVDKASKSLKNIFKK